MMRSTSPEREATASIRRSTDEIFGRWPLWPWSVFMLIAAGGLVGAAASTAHFAGSLNVAARGTFACAGYGMVTAAFLSLLPRIGKLLLLQRAAMRRPAAIDDSWWPLRLLPAALAATPTLRRTPEEFAAAVVAAGREVRAILAHRLWPAWTVAFIAPVLGLMTAWQNGATIQMRLRPSDEPGEVLPALISQVSPPMVATIGVSLALMVALVAIDQWTRGLLQRWRGVLEVADGSHPSVVGKLSLDPVTGTPRPADVSTDERPSSTPPDDTDRRLPTHPLDPEELDRLWKQSQSPQR